MSNKSNPTVATMGIDIGKNSFHVVGLDQRGAIVLRQKWSRRQIEARLANIPRCLFHGFTPKACLLSLMFPPSSR
jgi:transposase